MNKEIKSTEKKVSAKNGGAANSGQKAGPVLKKIWNIAWSCRGVLISLPVLWIAIAEAFKNAARLPQTVGLNIQATGEFALTVSRPTAVVIPLLITLGCIVMTCLTKRNLFPWLISIFSLVLPILIWIMNIYPA